MTISTPQRRIIQHGLIILIIGLLGGFLLAYSVMGYISFPPLPFTIDVQVPGTTAAWRAVHTGNIMNGLMAIILAGLFWVCDLTKKAQNWISWSLLFVIYGNCIFYVGAVFAPNRGLAIGDNAAGEGNLAGAIAFVPAVAAAYVLLIVIFYMLPRLKKATD